MFSSCDIIIRKHARPNCGLLKELNKVVIITINHTKDGYVLTTLMINRNAKIISRYLKESLSAQLAYYKEKFDRRVNSIKQ